MGNQENQKEKTLIGTVDIVCQIILCVVLLICLILILGNSIYNNFFLKDKHEAAMEVAQSMFMSMGTIGKTGTIDSEKVTLRYEIPDGYAYSEQNSSDKKKMYIADDSSQVICVSLEETDKKYTESDVDLLISNNFGSDYYTKSVETFGSNDFYVYRYSENSESGKNKEVPVKINNYVNVQDKYIICVDDILYENNPRYVSEIILYGNNSRDVEPILSFNVTEK